MTRHIYRRRWSQQRGQSMVEFAIVLPLLLVLLLAVGYFGHAVISLQNLNAGARSAARALALESTETPARRLQGNYAATGQRMLELARSYLSPGVRPEQLKVRENTRLGHDYNAVLNLQGSFSKISEHRFVYALSEQVDATAPNYNNPPPKDLNNRIPENLRQLKFGLGVMFYGGTLEYSLDELTPISRFIFRNQRDPAIKMGATALQPAELPLRGAGGLLELNPWLTELIGKSVENNPDYPDLIK